MGSGKKIKFFLIRKLAKLFISSIIFTCKIDISGEKYLQEITDRESPVIFIFWHRHIFFTIYRFRKSSARPLISFSPDGEIVSQIADEFGMDPVRGSSSKGGARAFLKIMNSIKKENSKILITADGPRGPLRELKDGTIKLAGKTGAAVVPISWYASKVKVFEKSWDKFMIPLPFSRIRFAYDKPVYIPVKITANETEDYKALLKSKLDKLEKGLMN
ncbi:MAG: lysophospholipid acyltransferase family protein [Acidobacteriota bacterium]